ncbi:winged helix-turn-helix domain-containing protein [Halorientalis sp. IM1011]|uniref:winged helix-turn-helix domain-containing protein n=1 Tax=Halorientalis sp. IM1011 TaxID=1932360 RepID=UPI00097CC5B4|nr:winged helix-turn-helix domain-containing protein [Halorientalis sp. IM1011]AQL42391.1 winged helix-turn-helix domain-containing protein [Halorientalis sp. IM1011]
MTRSPAKWMVPLDERILEILRSEGWSAPGYIAQKVSLFASIGRVRERCQMLADVELVEPLTEEKEHYEITGKGQRYLEGDLDATNLSTPSPQKALPRW